MPTITPMIEDTPEQPQGLPIAKENVNAAPTLQELLPVNSATIPADQAWDESPYPERRPLWNVQGREKIENRSETMKRALLETPFALFDQDAVSELSVLAGESPEVAKRAGTMAMKLVAARYFANAGDLDFQDAMQNFDALTERFFGEKIDDPRQVYFRLREMRQREEGPTLGERFSRDLKIGLMETGKGGIDTVNTFINKPVDIITGYLNYGFYKPLEWVAKKTGWEWGEKNFGAQTHMNFRTFSEPMERMSDEYRSLIAFEEERRGPSVGFYEDLASGVIRNLPNTLISLALIEAKAATMISSTSGYFGVTSFSSEWMDTRNDPKMSEFGKLINASIIGTAEVIFEEKLGVGRLSRKYWGKTIPAAEIRKISTDFGATLARTGKALALDAGGEGFEEVLTGATQRFSNLLFGKDGKTLASLSTSEIFQELCGPMPLEFSVGGVMGGGMGAVGVGHRFRQQRFGAQIQNFRAEIIGEAKQQLETLKAKEILTDTESRQLDRLDGAVKIGDVNAMIDLAFEQVKRIQEQQRLDELPLDEWAVEQATEALRQEKEFQAENRAAEAPRLEENRLSTVRSSVENLQFEYRGILKLEFVAKVENLPETVRNVPNFVPGVEGCFDTQSGVIYFVGENLNPGRVGKVFLHEAVGHQGLRGVFGSRYNVFLDQLARDHATNIAEVAKRRGIDLTTESGRLEAADEFMATLAEFKTSDLPLWKKVIATFRGWLRRLPGLRDLRYSDTELESLLSRSARTLRQQTEHKKSLGENILRFSLDQENGKAFPARIPATYREALANLRELQGHTFVNAETGIKAKLSATGINKIMSNKAREKSQANGFTDAQHMEAAANIDRLYENAILRGSSPDKKGSPDILSVKRFVAPFYLGEDFAEALITVKENIENGHRIYSLELEEIKKPSELKKLGAGLGSPARSSDGTPANADVDMAEQYPAFAGYENKILQKIEKARELLEKNSSNHDSETRFSAALRKNNNLNHAGERGKLIDGNVPHIQDFFKIHGLDGNRLYADYEFLFGRHNQYFKSQIETKAAVEFVLDEPEDANNISNNLAVVRRDSESNRIFRIEIRKKADPKRQNHIRSVHEITEEQYEKAKAGKKSPVLQPSSTGASGEQKTKTYSDFLQYNSTKYPEVKWSISPEYSERVKRLAAILTPHCNETEMLDPDAAAAILTNAGISLDPEANAILLHDAAWQSRELIRERHKQIRQRAEENHLRRKDAYYSALYEKYGSDFQIAAGPAYDGTKFSGTWMDHHKLAKNQKGIPLAKATKTLSEALGKELKESEVVEYFGNLKRENLLKDFRDKRARLRELRNIEDELREIGNSEIPRSLLAERNQYLYDRYPFIKAAIDYGGPAFLIRPSMRYKGEEFSGTFISPAWRKRSVKKFKTRKTGMVAIEAETQRVNVLESAPGIGSEELAEHIARNTGGDALTIENEIIDFFRGVKKVDLYQEFYAERREHREWEKDENRAADQKYREQRVRETAENAANEYKALLDEALRDKMDIIRIQQQATAYARRYLPKESRGEFLQQVTDLAKYSAEPAPAYPQGRRMYEMEKLLEKMQSFRLVERTRELADKYQQTVNHKGILIAPLGGEAQAELERIREILRIPGHMVATRISDLSETLSQIQDKGDVAKADELTEELELFRLFGRLDQRTQPEALEAFRALESLIQDKRDSFLAKLKAKREELGRLRYAAVVEITGNKDGLPRTGRNEQGPHRLKWLLEQRNLRGLLALVTNRSDLDFDDTVMGKLFGKLEESTWRNATLDRASNTDAEKAIERIFRLDSLPKKAAFWREAEQVNEHTGIFIDRYSKPVKYAMNQFVLVDGRGFYTADVTPEGARKLLQNIASGKAQLDPLAAEFLRQQLDDFDHGVVQEYQLFGNPDEDAAFNTFLSRQQKERKLTVFHPDPKAEKQRVELAVSRAEGATLLMAWEQPDVQSRMRWNGWNDESIDQLKKYIGRDFVEFAYWSRAAIAEKSKALDAKSRAIYGAGLPGLPNYYPVSYKESLGKQIGAGKSDYLGYGYGQMSINPSFLIKRKFHLSDVDLHRSIFQTHLQHQLEVNHFLSWAESIREVRGIFNDKRVREAISGTYGREVYNQIIDRIQMLARAGRDSGRAAELMGRLFRYWVPAKIALNFSSILKQFSGAASYMNEMPMKEFLANIAETFTDSPEFRRFVEFARNDDYFKDRIQGGFSRDIMYLMKSNRSGKIEDVYGNSLIDKGTQLTRWSDSIAALRGGYALFRHHYRNLIERGIEPGKAWEDAVHRWRRSTDETQQSGYLKDQNFYQSQAGFYRYLTSFLSNPIQIMNLELMTIDDIRFGSGKRKEQAKEKLARQILVNHVIVPTLMMLITQFFRNGFDYDEYEWEDFVTAGLLGPFEGAFIAGKVLQGAADAVAGKLVGRPSMPGKTVAEAFPMFDDSIIGLERLMNLADDLTNSDNQPDGAEYYRAIQSLADLLATSGTIAPIPHVGAAGAMSGAVLRELKRFWRLFGPAEQEK